MTPAIEIQGVSKTFFGNHVLRNIELQVRRGEVLALLGENGAGKSTLMKILSGALVDYAGEIRLYGEPVRFANPREAEQHGVVMIYQELNLVPEMSLAENIYLGREPTGMLGMIDRSRLRRDANRVLHEFEFRLPADTRISELRIGEQQVIEIARAMSRNARVLIMDEPTSALSEAEIATLFRLVRSLRNDGVTIIYISHRLDEIFAIADRVTVLRDGVLIGTLSVQDTERAKLIQMMVGRDIGEFATHSTPIGTDVVLEVEDLWLKNTSSSVKRDFAVQDVSFSVRAGEVLGISGLLGAGRSETLKTIFGAAQGTCGGVVRVSGRSIDFSTPERAKSNGVALVTEDRKGDGLVPHLGIAANISLASITKLAPGGLISTGRERSIAGKFMKKLGIRATHAGQEVISLSGGNQQKVVLAKWLATEPKVLLLDEPTRGIDIGAKSDIYQILAELCAQGIAVVLVSSDLEELVALADRVLVLRDGRPVAMLERPSISQQKILEYAASNHASLSLMHPGELNADNSTASGPVTDG